MEIRKIKSAVALLIILWFCFAATGIVMAEGTLPSDLGPGCDPEAQCCDPVSCSDSGDGIFELPNPLNSDSFEGLVVSIASWLRLVMIPLSAIMILWAAVLFMTSGGSEEQVTKAKRALFWALIGIGVILIGSGFITLIRDILTA